GPNNPVGVAWLGLSLKHYGIHGTPNPSGVGHRETNGCVHLTNWDVVKLASIAPVGTPVEVRE
ncbi:MAG TPA: L,D-transpeptidase, partial [Usitatibacter sp.]|nr:L,D-transpeptidase [Usitatibacter sp.]